MDCVRAHCGSVFVLIVFDFVFERDASVPHSGRAMAHHTYSHGSRGWRGQRGGSESRGGRRPTRGGRSDRAADEQRENLRRMSVGLRVVKGVSEDTAWAHTAPF